MASFFKRMDPIECRETESGLVEMRVALEANRDGRDGIGKAADASPAKAADVVPPAFAPKLPIDLPIDALGAESDSRLVDPRH